jgi:hypothetical protein
MPAFEMSTFADQVLHDLAPLTLLPDHAGAFQARVAQRLEAAGWAVEAEVCVSLPGSARRGRVDLVASQCACRVAIECDRLSPRDKSIRKLLAMSVDVRLVLLRRRLPIELLPSGVLVVGLEVEQW